MDSEEVEVGVLVVDEDKTCLATIGHALNSLECRALVAKGVGEAFDSLRMFEGFFDIVVTELHMLEMNGLEFLKRVVREFQLPVIMMSADGRKSMISYILANGATHYILKPLCGNDIKDIWKHAVAARKEKLSAENIGGESVTNDNTGGESVTNDNTVVQDVNLAAAPSKEKMKKRKYCRKKRAEMNNENQSEETSKLVKRPKVVWTKHLHNLFLLAIKQIGLEKAVPKKILEVMKMPNLTRENVASHLQKHRMFMKKVAWKGLFEGLSSRDLKSRFASGLTATMIKEFQERNAKFKVYEKRVVPQPNYEGIINALKPCNNVSRYTSTPLPYPNHNSLNMMSHNQHGNSLDQARFEVQPSYGNNHGVINIQQNMFGSNANPPYYEKFSNNNFASVFPSNGILEHGLMTSANGLRARLTYGNQQLMNQNYGSMGTYHHNFSYGQGNFNMESLNNYNNDLPSTTSTYNPSSNIQLNGESQMVGSRMEVGLDNTMGVMHFIPNNNNNFGFINETTESANVTPLEQGNFGLAQEDIAFASTSGVENDWSTGLLESLFSNDGIAVENLSGNTQLPQQVDNNVEENENADMGDDISNFLKKLDEMDFVIEPEENHNTNEFSMFDFSSSSHSMQSVEQSSNVVSDVIADPLASIINLSNESSTSYQKNPNQPEENHNTNEFSMFDFSSSSHSMQSIEQSNNVASDVIVDPLESIINLPNESSTSYQKNPNQPEENLNANEFSMFDFSSSSHSMQSVQQSNNVVSDVIAEPLESTINLSNESSTTSSYKNTIQLGGEEGFKTRKNFLMGDDSSTSDSVEFMNVQNVKMFSMDDDVPSASGSIPETDLDIDFIEAWLGADQTK